MKKIALNVNLFDEILLTGTKNKTVSIEPNERGELKLVFEEETNLRQCTETDSLTLEKDADLFASKFIKDHKFEIWSIMNNITIDEAIAEYNFWNI